MGSFMGPVSRLLPTICPSWGIHLQLACKSIECCPFDFFPVCIWIFSIGLSMIVQASFKVYEKLNSQHFTLPQRRHRVWGVATLLSAGVDPERVRELYRHCLRSLRTNFQFPRELNFGNKPHEPPRNSRHQDHVSGALALNFGDLDLFLDCAGTKGRPAVAHGVKPCITPRHPIYSVALERYMDSEDILNGQGLWKSNFSETGWKSLMASSTLAQGLAGNSFSSTVCQAVFLSSIIASSPAWGKLGVQENGLGSMGAGNEEPHQILRRVRQKRKAPEFDQMEQSKGSNSKKNRFKQKPGNAVRKPHKRKVPGVDSRAKSSSGKKMMVTIYEKERVNLAFKWKQ